MTANNKIDNVPYEKIKYWIEKANELSAKHWNNGEYSIDLTIDQEGLFIKSTNTSGDIIK